MTAPITIDTPLRYAGPPPKACDVVVLGGGVIGVMTAWFLAERGFSEAECQQVTCPIGVPGILGKEPEVIAVAVAAQLLQA